MMALQSYDSCEKWHSYNMSVSLESKRGKTCFQACQVSVTFHIPHIQYIAGERLTGSVRGLTSSQINNTTPLTISMYSA